ncbi:hypothetical protein E3N88_14515 [Mikania micrantha]|uniref:Uncharacterized protein n=1 Tax=Mikania micrantha TaxID=192012 RepID=A0A5N6P4Q2_9ASTR|nr:hypothetical protein E3N88_14515 [Mikania micrantha]
MEVRFGSNEWKVLKGNLVIARGMKHGSLYLVDEPAEGKRNKIWFAKSRAKRVHFANVKSGAKEMLAERVQKSKPFRGFGDSGSKGCVPGTVTKSRWVLKTRTEEFSPVGSLLCLESVGGPRCISGSDEVSIPVEIEDESLTGFVTTELELGGASTGPSSYSLELRLGRLVIEDYWIYWMTGLLMLDAGLDYIARPPSGRLLAICWRSWKQEINMLSSTKAEYVAALSCNTVKLGYCKTKEQVAEVMTKPMKLDVFVKMINWLGLQGLKDEGDA